MASSLLVVEGAHDASFFGHLLAAKGYRQARYLHEVPEHWKPLIPVRYPVARDEYLDRVIRFPDIHVAQTGHDCGIIVAGGDTRAINGLRTALEQLGPERFRGIGIVIDVDHDHDVNRRFDQFVDQLAQLNKEAQADGTPGFPLPLPTAPGELTPGTPALGIYLFPDNQRQGALETVLLECAALEHAVLEAETARLVGELAQRAKAHPASLKALAGVSGRAKAQAGMIANVLQPGDSLAVAVQKGGWFGATALTMPGVALADGFLDSLLPGP